MPRDANGNYTLPAGNPVTTNTLITSTWANDTMSDLGAEMQDSLSRSGKGGFTAPVGVVDKSGSVPGLNFVAEPTSGLKRENPEDLRIQVTATDVAQFFKTGVKILSGGTLKVPVVEETGQKVMRGVGGTTVMTFYNATPPTGWTFVAPDTFARDLVLSPVDGGGGVVGGSINPTVLTDTVSVSLSGVVGVVDISHTHGAGTLVTQQAPQDQGAAGGANVLSRDDHVHTITGSTAIGGDSSHTHGVGTLTGVGNVSIEPRYALVVLGTLNA